MTFSIMYFLKMRMVKKLIVLIADDFFIYVYHPQEVPNFSTISIMESAKCLY